MQPSPPRGCSACQPEQTLAALGTGATQSAGMKVVYGSMGKSLHAGKAAMDGLLSGFLARDGFTSATEPIEGHRGFLHLFSPDPMSARAIDGLGDVWYLPRDGFKPYACGSLTHPPAQAVLELRSDHDLSADDVASVDAYVHDYVKTTTGLAEPRTGLEGKFSIYHVLAVALADGAAFLDQFTDERVADPELARLRKKVHVHTDPAQNKDSARVVLTLRDGQDTRAPRSAQSRHARQPDDRSAARGQVRRVGRARAGAGACRRARKSMLEADRARRCPRAVRTDHTTI